MASAYTPAQISQWESHVGLPQKYRQASSYPLDATYLTALHMHQIAAIPYENLSLHYSALHTISLDPQNLFKKMVTDKRGRGGYCMENSILFHHILKALDFNVYMAGVRIRPRVGGVPGGDYTGWVHIVNIVTLANGTKYSLDVGFGGDGATKPLPLVSGHVVQNLGSQEIRLVHEPLPHSNQRGQLHWVYQYRNGKEMEWNAFYAFPDLEFFQRDFEIMNHWTSTSMAEMNFQTKRVLIVRFLKGPAGEETELGEGREEGLNEYEGEVIVGKVMLVDGEVKRNDGGKTRTLMVCESEEERVKVIQEEFGIRLTDEEIRGIRGRNVELRVKET